MHAIFSLENMQLNKASQTYGFTVNYSYSLSSSFVYHVHMFSLAGMCYVESGKLNTNASLSLIRSTHADLVHQEPIRKWLL
jgi:hypothetical protein